MSNRDSRLRSRRRRDSIETLVEIHPRSFGVKVDDTTWKVLPAALDKYGLGSKNWEVYVLFLCYDSNEPGYTQKQRCLSYDEKPLQLWILLKNMGKNPAFMVKHFDDIKSPISVIRERHMGRHGADSHIRDSNFRNGSITTGPTTLPVVGATYAVAIFPYWAEASDELDAALDDAFVVLSRAPGWWMVRRHDTDSGVNKFPRTQGWVPSGALLEISIPVATAIAKATKSSRKSIVKSLSTSYAKSSKPILRSHILSNSFPAVGLKNYHTKGDGELALITGDLVRVYKVYNNWSYAIKENGDRGWMPSWFLGKVSWDPSNPDLSSATLFVS